MSDPRWQAAFAQVPGPAAQHVLLAAAALRVGDAGEHPAGAGGARRPGLRRGALAVAGAGADHSGTCAARALLSAAAGDLRAGGGGVPALGFLPSLLALTVYAVLPILRNTLAALAGSIRPCCRRPTAGDDGGAEAPAGRGARWLAPVAMAASGRRRWLDRWHGDAFATTVGQPSLGNLIFAGLQTENWVLVVAGMPRRAAALALAADRAARAGGARAGGAAARAMMAGLGGIALGLAAAGLSLAGPARATVTVGARNFSEQYILARAIGERLERAGYAVALQGGAGIGRGVAGAHARDIDVYVDYSGTLWANAHGAAGQSTRARDERRHRALGARSGRAWQCWGPLGFENAYALAMRRDRARALGVASIADLARVAPRLTLGSDLEFLDRPEWAAIRDAYGLRFAAMHAYAPSFMYRALTGGQADVISAFSSDGRIAARDLLVLADPDHAVPAYDALLLAGRRGAADPRFRAALAPLAGAIPVDRMRTANYMVDRDTGKKKAPKRPRAGCCRAEEKAARLRRFL